MSVPPLTEQFLNLEGHICDWRVIALRQDSHVEVMCMASGHNLNTKWRIAPKMVKPEQMPRYDGFGDVL